MQPQQPDSPTLSTGAVQVIGIVCAIGVAALLYGAAYLPLSSWRTSVNQEADMLRAKLPHAEVLRTQHIILKQELTRLEEQVAEINRRVPDEPQDGEFLANISKLAEQHGVFLEDFRRKKIEDQPTHSTVSVALSGQGSYTALCRFLASIDELPRMSTLTDMKIRSSGEDQAPYPIELSYTLYYGLKSAE